MTPRERPILFSGEMIQAIIAGRKTQTRRVLKVPKHIKPDGLVPMTWAQLDAEMREQGYDDEARSSFTGPRWDGQRALGSLIGDVGYGVIRCPYGDVGDRCWVREAWRIGDWDPPVCAVEYRATPNVRRWTSVPPGEQRDRLVQHGFEDGDFPRGRSPIYMPRWASRFDLTITDIRVQRLNEITEDDAIAEGIQYSGDRIQDGARTAPGGKSVRGTYRDLWDSLNAKRGHGWETSPWVWALSFEMEA